PARREVVSLRTRPVQARLSRLCCNKIKFSKESRTHKYYRFTVRRGAKIHMKKKSVLCLAGVIAVVIFVIVAGLAITARFLYRRKETYRNQEVKGVQREDSQDLPFNNRTDSQNASTGNPKEYFI
uniref:Neurexin/syndecan/glycophorin C domain-containing protein n=1 Tax=Cyclopterus lumpus TaxID=8103 RepID=A0A8C3G610_CYCLU